MPDGGGLAVVVFVGIVLEAVESIGLLFVGQPLGGLGEVGNDEAARVKSVHMLDGPVAG